MLKPYYSSSNHNKESKKLRQELYLCLLNSLRQVCKVWFEYVSEFWMFRQARLPNKISIPIQKTKTTFFCILSLTCNLSIVSIRRAATAIKIYIVITSIKNKTIETSHFMIKRESSEKSTTRYKIQRKYFKNLIYE